MFWAFLAMLQGRSRELVKRLLEVSRAKLVFNRITQTRYTRLYFFLSAFTCLLLCALQAVILSDNTKAVDILTAAVDEANPAPHITILKDGELHVCDSIPDRQDSNCVVLWLSNANSNTPLSIQRRSRARRSRRSRVRRQVQPVEEEEEDEEEDSSDDEGGVSSSDEEGGVSSDDDDGGVSSDDEEDLEDAAESTGGGALPTAVSSTSPTSTVTTSVSATGETSVVISSSSSAGATSIVVAATSTRTPAPTSTGVPNPNSPLSDISLNQNSNSPYSMRCIYSMSWLGEVLHDSQREDAATMFFHVWLFGLSLVAILNESLPHLGAAFAGHILAAGWSSSRIQGAKSLAQLYRDVIIAGPCEGADLLGSWWEMRFAHTIPVVVFNILSVLGLGFLSYKLLKVYSAASFYKVGPTRTLQRVYKIVLVFSVGLQLSGFFTAVSSGLWISKVAHGNFKALSRHEALYIAGFVVVMLAELPWLILGWVCVRKECKKRFWVFAVLSAVLIVISSVIFSSEAYRTIFKSWRFFATVTVTAFVLLLLTVILGFVCYFNYGKGLQTYLQMVEEPEGADFDPVGRFKAGEKEPEQPFPASFYGYAPAFHEKSDVEWSSPEPLPKPPTAAEVSRYLSRTAPPAATPQPQLAVASNPFESDLDAGADARMKSVWSANTSDFDARSFRTLTVASPTSEVGVPPGFQLQLPPRAGVPQPRVPSFNGTVDSLEPYAGLPTVPITPKAHSRGSSVRSITRAPFPTNANVTFANSTQQQHARSNSMSSTNSGRSIRISPFPTAPVSSISRSTTTVSRDSGYPTSSYQASSSEQSSVVGRYLTPSPFGGAVANSALRHSTVSSVGGDYQVAQMSERRETLGAGSPLIQEVPRNLYITN